jgi:AcrR family transcriptional regulator
MAARKSGRRAAGGGAAPADIVGTTLKLIAARGWRSLSLADIAAANKMSLAALYAVYPSKLAILDAYWRRVNEATLGGPVETDGSARDRLFDLVMRRLDALKPHKEALRAIIRDLPYDPRLALCRGPRFLNAMSWIAEAAGLDTGGVLGPLRVKGVAVVYLIALRAFLRDETADGGTTMAALDQALKRAEMLARSIPGFVRQAGTSAA